ncbi:hypothetical protein [Desulfoferrobacter suflitae]|uniref:hypothetical protein n=1 Tax=Desulfoferrobacter suflitae TaxID=2865782 RepID=UPI00216480F2|nr:hypothetical protein [Desulfoferrobacter suflitae]MCK8602326.1 hypothetical protein [Desulfoferrobacter suflitae]
MSQKVRLLDLFEGKRYQKIVLTIAVLAFLVLELLIYLAAASQAGQKTRVVVTDHNGAIKYETAGTSLTSYERMTFENTFGPLENYQIQIQTDSQPFPFRAWLSAAVGIPVGLVLLVSFVVKVYLNLLYGEEKDKPQSDSESATTNRFGSLFHLFNGFSIFHVGFFLVVAVLLLWMVPNFLGDFLKISIVTIREFKWFFLGASLFIAFLVTWVIFLRYKLSKKMLENQLDIEKFRVEKQLLIQAESPPLLPGSINEAQEQ